MKALSFSHGGRSIEVATSANILQALLAERLPVTMACGGKGLCATCHVYIERGADGLTPRSAREERTLGLIRDADRSSRLACQARVLRDGVVVRLPPGLYIEKLTDLKSLVGRRADARILHPIDGRVLVEQGKIITKSIIDKLAQLDVDMRQLLEGSRAV